LLNAAKRWEHTTTRVCASLKVGSRRDKRFWEGHASKLHRKFALIATGGALFQLVSKEGWEKEIGD
jgi:hypothetical protein